MYFILRLDKVHFLESVQLPLKLSRIKGLFTVWRKVQKFLVLI